LKKSRRLRASFCLRGFRPVSLFLAMSFAPDEERCSRLFFDHRREPDGSGRRGSVEAKSTWEARPRQWPTGQST
jgi:hypothetical protein